MKRPTGIIFAVLIIGGFFFALPAYKRQQAYTESRQWIYPLVTQLPTWEQDREMIEGWIDLTHDRAFDAAWVQRRRPSHGGRYDRNRYVHFMGRELIGLASKAERRDLATAMDRRLAEVVR